MPTAIAPQRPRTLPTYVTQTDYLEAVGLWLSGGKQGDVASLLRIPKSALNQVIHTAEWRNTADQYRASVALDEAGALSRLIHKALHATAVRLEQGDPHVLKSGDIIYKPVAAKDAAAIAALFIDRRKDVYKQIDGVREGLDAESITDLIKIATALNKRYDVTPKPEAIDVTPEEEKAA